MRQTWKGLTVGAVVGAGIGLVLDGLSEGAERAESAADKLGRMAKRRAPEAKARLREAGKHGMSAVREKDLPGLAQAAAEKAAGKIEKAADKAATKAGATDTGRKAHDVLDAVSDRLS